MTLGSHPFIQSDSDSALQRAVKEISFVEAMVKGYKPTRIASFFTKFLDVKTQQRGITHKGVVNCCVLLMPK